MQLMLCCLLLTVYVLQRRESLDLPLVILSAVIVFCDCAHMHCVLTSAWDLFVGHASEQQHVPAFAPLMHNTQHDFAIDSQHLVLQKLLKPRLGLLLKYQAPFAKVHLPVSQVRHSGRAGYSSSAARQRLCSWR